MLISFSYQRLSLHDLNFKVTAGQTLSIIGGTGSGKSALVNLIPRLFDIESGEIKVDGVPVKKLSQHNLHEVISITQQQAVLFKGNIHSNIQFGYEEARIKKFGMRLKLRKQQISSVKKADWTRCEQNGSNFLVVNANGSDCSNNY